LTKPAEPASGQNDQRMPQTACILLMSRQGALGPVSFAAGTRVPRSHKRQSAQCLAKRLSTQPVKAESLSRLAAFLHLFPAE